MRVSVKASWSKPGEKERRARSEDTKKKYAAAKFTLELPLE